MDGYEIPPIVSIVLYIDVVISLICISLTINFGLSYAWFFIFSAILIIIFTIYVLFLSIGKDMEEG